MRLLQSSSHAKLDITICRVSSIGRQSSYKMMSLVIFLKDFKQVKYPKYIPSFIFDLTLVGVECELTLCFREYYILPTLRKICDWNSFL